jgi:hypothetical protein
VPDLMTFPRIELEGGDTCDATNARSNAPSDNLNSTPQPFPRQVSFSVESLSHRHWL